MEQIPLLLEPYDTLRLGPATIKGQTRLHHPVQQIEKHFFAAEHRSKKHMLAAVYGQHFPKQLMMEEAILSQIRRPGLSSSLIGLETSMGLDEEIDFKDFLGKPEYSTKISLDQHADLEKRYR